MTEPERARLFFAVGAIVVVVSCAGAQRGSPRTSSVATEARAPTIALDKVSADAVRGGIPSCRLDGTSAEVMRTLGARILQIYRRHYPRLVGALSVNDESEAGGAIRLLLIRDGYVGNVDSHGCPLPGQPVGSLDAMSVRSICAASASEVRCSANALASVETKALPLSSSPTLLFLLAHELAHIALGHEGAFAEPLAIVDLARPEREKLKLLLRLCGADGEAIAIEQAADTLAADASAEILQQAPYSESILGRAGSLAANAQRMRNEIDDMRSWGCARVNAPVDDVPLYVQPDIVCKILRRESGAVVLPVQAGTHPRGERRVTDITTRMLAQVNRMVPRNAQDPVLDRADPEARSLQLEGMFQQQDQESSALEAESAEAFCKWVFEFDADPTVCPEVPVP